MWNVAGRGGKRHGNRIMELETVANEGSVFVASKGDVRVEMERGFCSGNLLMEPMWSREG